MFEIVVFVVCSCLLQYGDAHSGYGSILPGSCTRSPYVVLGAPFQWQYPDGFMAEEGNCSFWGVEGAIQEWAFIDSQYTFYRTGDYTFQCTGEFGMEHSGSFSVVPARYTIALCKDCNRNRQYTINAKDLLRWTIAEMDTNCTVSVTNLETGHPVYQGLGTDYYQFNKTGTYEIYCMEDSSISAAVLVTDNGTDDDDDDDQYEALVYIHAGLMGLTFGILFPIGAFLASHKYFHVHMISQPMGLALAITGLVMVVAYVEVTSGKHFDKLIHGVVGLALLVLVFLIMPILLAKKQWRRWHRRTGHIVAFFGMGNVLLGLAILPAPHAAALTVCILYGIWLVIAIVVYVLWPPQKEAMKSSSELRVDANKHTTEGSTRIKVGRLGSIFSRQGSETSGRGPQPLSKNIISETKMVELRKMSIDPVEALRQRDAFEEKVLLQQQYSKSDMEFLELQRSTPSIKDEHTEDSLDELDDSQVGLLPAHIPHSSLEPGSGISPQPYNQSPHLHDLDSDSSDDEKTIFTSANKPPTPGSVTIQRAHTFNVPHSSVDSDDNLSRGGSLRITRHSKRALNKSTEDIFPGRKPTSNEPPPPQNEMQISTGSHKKFRKRRALAPPPIICTTPANPSPLTQTLQPQVDSLSSHQDVSPSPSALGYQGASPRSQRKKKVSMARIEATVVPPTPVTLEVPQSTGFSQSSDGFMDNALRAAMEMSQDAIICSNSIGEIVFWSPEAIKMFGYTPGEAIGSSLEMIMPQKYKERHRQGINKRTEDTLKYIRKHSYIPEEQKHPRVYVVHGIAKNRHEFPVEVTVTTFVLDGELFYTGVIAEMARHRSTRAASVSSAISDTHESILKQKAMAVGAQMKIAHQLQSAEHISQQELIRVLSGSLQTTKFEVEPQQMGQMVTGIMKAGDPTGSGVITFTNLIKLLSKHRLYISESGLIARYWKTKETEQRSMSNRRERLVNATKHFIYTELSSIFWFLVYLALNILLMLIGVLATDKEGWKQWAYGTGPVLSMNCILVLLPTLSSLIQAMRNSKLMNSIFPLTHTLVFHMIIAGGIAFWTTIHLLTHFASFAIHSQNKTEESTIENFRENFKENLCPAVTGFLILTILTIMTITSVNPIRKQFRFIPFYIIHWVGAGLFYLLLVLHGVDCYNPSFWKWLLPAVVIFVIERLYRHIVVEGKEGRRATVKNAGAYDHVSSTGVIELEKPKGFRFAVGQYLMLNIPWIAYFNWHAVQITSGPKENKLTVYIQREDDLWSKEVFSHLKAQPHGRQVVRQVTEKKQEEGEEEGVNTHLSVLFTGPFGPGNDAIFDYKISTLVCGGNGPHGSKAIIKKLLDYRKGSSCTCGYHPMLNKLYFVWVTPSENNFEWFTDYLSDLCEDENFQRYLDIRVFLTNKDSHPDELASALLQLGLKTAGETCKVRRPSQPQLNNLYHMTSYGVPDFDSLLDYIQAQHGNKPETEFGVFTIGELHHTMKKDLQVVCTKHTKPGQLTFNQHHIIT